MKSSPAIVLAMLIVAACAPLSRGQTQPTSAPAIAAALKRDVLAHGSDARLWVAVIVPNTDRNTPGERTIIRTRGTGDDARWENVTELATRVSAIHSRGSELVALLSNGEWRLIGGEGNDVVIRSGVPLPRQAQIVALAGTDDTLWAIGFGDAPFVPIASATTSAPATIEVEATTRPSTEPGASTAPTTQPLPRLRLYRLDAGRWTAIGELPESIKLESLQPFAFAVIAGEPTIAAPIGDGAIHVFQWSKVDAGGIRWVDRELPPLSLPAQEVSLLDLRKRLLLWASSASGATSLVTLDDDARWSAPVPLTTSAPTTAPVDRVIAAAFAQTWLISIDRTGRLTEQAIDAGGKASNEPTEIATRSPTDVSRIGQIINLGVMLLLTWVMVVALRRRGRLQRALLRLDELHLAPLGPRFAAGAIDAIPLLVFSVIGFTQTDASFDSLESQLTEPAFEMWVLISIGAYLAYTTATEMIFGRTPGKMLLGLRVADLDGQRPGARAMLGRNLLRIVDVVLVFPVAMVLFSPLRQRVGDLAAGTIVITGDLLAPKPGATPEEDEV